MILSNLIQASSQLLQKKIESFFKKVHYNHSWRKNKDIKPIREISFNYLTSTRNSNIDNDKVIERLKVKSKKKTIRMSRNSKDNQHVRSSSSIMQRSLNDKRQLLTSNSYNINNEFNHMMITKNTLYNNDNRDYDGNGISSGSDPCFNIQKSKEELKKKICENANSLIGEMLLTKFHNILNQYNNQLSDEESLIKNKQISEFILNNAKKKREHLYSIQPQKQTISNNSP